MSPLEQQDWQFEQEMNLLYVALTRSKSELFIVGDCDWYTEKKEDNKDKRSQQPETQPQQLQPQQAKPENDYFALLRQAKEDLDNDLYPLFSDDAKRGRLIEKLTQDSFALENMEDAGSIQFTSEKNKNLVYAANQRYWDKFYAASRQDEEEETKRPSYRYAGMESEFWTGEDFYDDF